MQPQDVTKLTTPWQSRLGTTGQVVQGFDDIEQSIKVICRTQIGEVPCSDVGVDWLALIDLEVNEAVPKAVNQIMLALARFEPRAVVRAVVPFVETEGLARFRIVWEPKGIRGVQRETDVQAGSIAT